MSEPANFAFFFVDGRPTSCAPEKAWQQKADFVWVHLDHAHSAHRASAMESQLLPEEAEDALWADVSRPRLSLLKKGILINLRGVNLNPGKDPDDMVSLRVWITDHLITTVSIQPLRAVHDIRMECESGHTRTSPMDILIGLIIRLLARKQEVVENLEELIDQFEDNVLEGENLDILAPLASVRRQCIRLRRFLAPQRDVLWELLDEDSPLNPQQRRILHDLSDRSTRFLEDLESARERSAVIQDQLAGAQAEKMNKTMLVLSVVASIFLPLSFVTGLLGINVGGIPLAQSPHGFLLICILLLLLGIAEIWWARKSKWLS